MGLSAKRTVYPALILAAFRLALGQTAQPKILTIDLENFVEYRGDTSDVSLYGTNAAVTGPAAILCVLASAVSAFAWVYGKA